MDGVFYGRLGGRRLSHQPTVVVARCADNRVRILCARNGPAPASQTPRCRQCHDGHPLPPAPPFHLLKPVVW